MTGPRLELMAPGHEPVITFRRAFDARERLDEVLGTITSRLRGRKGR